MSPSAGPEIQPDHQQSTLHRSQIRVAVCLLVLFAYILAIFGWLANMTPIDASVCFIVAGVLGWLTLRLHPGWMVIFLLAITWCIQGTPGRYQAWFESIQLAAWGGILVAWRTNFNAISSEMEQQISSFLTPRPPRHRAGTKAISRERTLGVFLVKGLLEVLVVIAFAIALAVLAGILLGRNPLGGGYEDWVEWTTQSGRALWPSPLLIVLVIGMLIAFRERDKRRITADQARVWIKSESMRWQYRDLLRVTKAIRKIKGREKNQVTKTKAEGQ